MAEGPLQGTGGTGPVGTGFFVFRWSRTPSGAWLAEVWLAVLFVPLLPLGRWEVEATAPDTPFVVRGVRPPSLGSSLAWYSGAALLVAVSLVPGYLSLGLFMGRKVLELGGTFLSAGLILGLAGWLDEARARMPLRVVLRVLGGRRTA